MHRLWNLFVICRLVLCPFLAFAVDWMLNTNNQCSDLEMRFIIIIIINPLTMRVTTGDFTTNFLNFSLFSTTLWDLANPRPVHSLMLSSHLSFCLLCLLPPFTVPCKTGMARPDKWETCPYHCSLSLYNGQEVFMWSNCLLDLGTDFLIGNLVSVWDA